MSFFKGLIVGVAISTLFIIVYINTANSSGDKEQNKFATDGILLAGSRVIAGDPDQNEFFILGANEPDPPILITKKQVSELNKKMTFLISEVIAGLQLKIAEGFEPRKMCFIPLSKGNKLSVHKKRSSANSKIATKLPAFKKAKVISKNMQQSLHKATSHKPLTMKNIKKQKVKVTARNIYKARLLKLITTEHEKMRRSHPIGTKTVVMHEGFNKKKLKARHYKV